ncbi:MAG: hypothetical protein A2X46_08015 [Lentisphaerae bacterium GWF2_57_35]|nr:MAG: hypothetical protein A2X46_08015 [Lentisphaerae bacterium GWF2_57_35]
MEMYAGSISPECFPRAAEYAGLGIFQRPLLREKKQFRQIPDFSERHLQCIWFDARWRPSIMQTSSGEEVRVEDPGIWNLEAGPDFLGAALRVGTGNRRIRGDVEIHVHPSDWKQHGHAEDRRYAQVKAHVTFFPGVPEPTLFPPGVIHVALKNELLSNPLFSFENVDITAYPMSARCTEPPCRRVISAWTPEARMRFMEAAGEERLRRKAERMAASIREKGVDQALYEEIMCALGYKGNKQPFRILAERIPFQHLHALDAFKAYALLLGVSGLLPENVEKKWDEETREFVRAIWDTWWKIRGTWEKKLLTRSDWQLNGLRPANHPIRRLMAAAHLFTAEKPLAERLDELIHGSTELLAEKVEKIFRIEAGAYWERRWALSGKPTPEPVALLGPSRITAIHLNVILPFAAAAGLPMRELLRQIPTEPANLVIKQTAWNLFGPDQAESLYRQGLRQQGLTQIFYDFCMNDRSRCEECFLPQMLEAGKKA